MHDSTVVTVTLAVLGSRVRDLLAVWDPPGSGARIFSLPPCAEATAMRLMLGLPRAPRAAAPRHAPSSRASLGYH